MLANRRQQQEDSHLGVLWLELPERTAFTEARDLVPIGPAVSHHSELGGILQDVHSILDKLSGSVQQEVELTDDPEWKVHPEVGRAFKQAGGEEQCMCIAVCASRGLWGAGVASKWKRRESSAKLALAVALAWHLEDLDGLSQDFPEFAEFVHALGYRPETRHAAPKPLINTHRRQHQNESAYTATSESPYILAQSLERKNLTPLPKKRAFASRELQATGTVKTGGVKKNSVVSWVSLHQESPLVVENQVLPTAPVILPVPELNHLLTDAHRILEDIVGDLFGEVEIFNFNGDPARECPDVSAAVEDLYGAQKRICIAMSSSRSLWAVGAGGNVQQRVNAAKLALCVALAWHMEDFKAFAQQWPEFAEMCHSITNSKAASTRVQPVQPVQRVQRVKPVERAESPPKKQRKFSIFPETKPRKPAAPPTTKPSFQATGKEARPLWIHFSEDARVHPTLSGLASGALVLQHSWDERFQDLQGSAHNLLKDLVGDIESEVQIIHDPAWDEYAEVGEHIKQAGGEEVAMCIAACPAHGKWAVGQASKWKHREAAAKVALCVSIAPETDKFDKLIKEWPAFADMCADAGVVDPDAIPGRSRRRAQQLPPLKRPVPHQVRRLPTQVSEPLPPPLWIRLEEPLPDLLTGLISEALVLQMPQDCSLMGIAQNLLRDVLGDVASEVQLLHDAQHEELAQATEIVNNAIGDATWSCIAVSPSHARWAVGVAGKRKRREAAAKLALCATLAPEADNYSELAGQWPEFAELCEQVAANAGKPPQQTMKVKAEIKAEIVQESRRRPSYTVRNEELRVSPDILAMPAHLPMWTRIPDDEEMPSPISMCLREVLVVRCEGNGRRNLYSEVDAVLDHLGVKIDGDDDEVEFHDDADWDKYPEVGKALKLLGEKEECMTIAVSPSRGVWAVGVGMKSKNRFAAAKVAIAASMVMQTDPDGSNFFDDMEGMQATAKFVQQAYKASLELST